MKRYVLTICAGMCLFIISHQSLAQGIKASPTSGFILSCAGAPSASPHIEQIQVSATGLTGNVTAKAPAGFEISATPTGSYSNSLVLLQSSGTLNNTIVYVRSAASAPTGYISGNVVLSSPGAVDQSVAVTGLIHAVITLDPVPNQTVKAGAATAVVNFTGSAGAYTWTNNTPGIGLPASGNSNIQAFTAINNGTTPITATITVTPTPVEFAYVANLTKNVNVIDLLNGQLIGSILVGFGPESVVISPDGLHAYICDVSAQDIAFVDASTFTVTNAISPGFGSRPNYVAISPDGSTLYVSLSALKTVVAISTTTKAVIATMNVGDHPVGITVSLDGKMLYVTNVDGQSITVINTKFYGVVNTISLNYPPYATAVSPDGSKLYVATSGADSRVLVIDAATGNIIANIPVAASAQSIAITPDGAKVYVTDNNANTVTVISTATNSITSTINVGTGPYGIAVTPDGSLVCVTEGTGNDVSVISTATDQVVRTVHSASAIALGDFVTGTAGCIGPPVTFTITVNPILPPALTASANLQGLTTTYGTSSSPESFTISGSNLTGDILVTAPPGFEVSADGNKFSSTISITTDGNATTLPVYIRLAATATVGTYSGDIVLSSPGTTTIKVAMPNSVVTKALLQVIANDQTKIFGAPNPDLTVSYKGFVNGDKQDELTVLPVATTTATTSSAPGQYVITADGAKSPNYNFTYTNGTLTVLPSLQFAVIPNAFTPNGDGINDFWNIPQLAYFPNCLVSIYTRYGGLVFQSRGYAKPWDGTSKGSPVPTGTYYYVIDPQQEAIKPLTGYVAVLR